MIAALKQHYEHYHAGDLTALKKLYEYHAENCVKAAELTEDTRQREEYLKLAREWTEAARSALDMNALDAKYRRNNRATDISDEMRAAVVEARGRSLRTSCGPQKRNSQIDGSAEGADRELSGPLWWRVGPSTLKSRLSRDFFFSPKKERPAEAGQGSRHLEKVRS